MREPTRAAAEAFVQYLFTPEAQAEFADNGFRWCLQPPHTSTCTHAHSLHYMRWPLPCSGNKTAQHAMASDAGVIHHHAWVQNCSPNLGKACLRLYSLLIVCRAMARSAPATMRSL